MEGTTVRTYDHTKIKKFRKAAKLTQYQLAMASGVPLDTIRDYEQGRSTPSVIRLFVIANTLNRKLDDFATEIDNEGNACSQKITARS